MKLTEENLFRCRIANSIARQMVSAGQGEADLLHMHAGTLPEPESMPTPTLAEAVTEIRRFTKRGELWRALAWADWLARATDHYLAHEEGEPPAFDLEVIS